MLLDTKSPPPGARSQRTSALLLSAGGSGRNARGRTTLFEDLVAAQLVVPDGGEGVAPVNAVVGVYVAGGFARGWEHIGQGDPFGGGGGRLECGIGAIWLGGMLP